MNIRKITTRRELREFVRFREDLYAGSEWAVPYPEIDEMDTLSKKKNPAFEFCEADYFLCEDNGRTVGRVAAIINHRANEKWNTRTVRFGFIDFIDDREVSRALVETVEQWGRERGMDTIVGPMGFTDMDREGMLVEGFEEIGNMYTTYNHAYYQDHIEALGFVKDNDYLMLMLEVPERVPEKMEKVAQIARERYNLKVLKPSRLQYMTKYARKVFEILNTTYAHLYGFAEMTERQISLYARTYIVVADPKLVVVIADGNDGDRPIGFGVSFPSMSKALQHLRRGSLWPMGWWHVAKALLHPTTDHVDLMLIGVLPEYRRKGANALVFDDLLHNFFDYGFRKAEVMPQMETNTIALSNWEYFNHRQHKRLRCYTKKIDF